MSFLQPMAQPADAARLRFGEVRAHSVALAALLSPEDQCVHSMPDASPTKWHLAHSTWFFETVLLQMHATGYQQFDTRFPFLFNSYYESLGPRHPRPERGLLTRPSIDAVHAYRQHVDAAVMSLMDAADGDLWATIEPIFVLGLHHEQQHQELLVTDILHALSCNPLLPAYRPANGPTLRLASVAEPARWLLHEGGVVDVGHQATGDAVEFAFDNETPRHSVLQRPFEIADRVVTCGEYAHFIADGSYQRPELWLSDGWASVKANDWRAPPYWLSPDDSRVAQHGASTAGWQVFGLHGIRPMEAEAPVSQLSFYEASAYAEWAGARLPTEFEWEAASSTPGFLQATGHVWQWTRSSYDPYPGFRPMTGIAAEYNGKFMVGQLVLRGGRVATPNGHTRPSYRNFFPPAARWQFTGVRLARDI